MTVMYSAFTTIPMPTLLTRHDVDVRCIILQIVKYIFSFVLRAALELFHKPFRIYPPTHRLLLFCHYLILVIAIARSDNMIETIDKQIAKSSMCVITRSFHRPTFSRILYQIIATIPEIKQRTIVFIRLSFFRETRTCPTLLRTFQQTHTS